jgi:hypothetical protein
MSVHVAAIDVEELNFSSSEQVGELGTARQGKDEH